MQDRIIPARAGFTGSRAYRLISIRDHPRSRGVYASTGITYTAQPGSSPLARGLRTRSGIHGYGLRIIPARAGFTTSVDLELYRDQDHPRSRGVYEMTLLRDALTVGSSPLARGLRVGIARLLVRHRIIPARAGFTRPEHNRNHGPTDHPRSRGVYGEMTPRPSSTLGSSPLARGLPLRHG